MKHARADYDRIQDPSGKIGKDEPVFLIRAKDRSAAIMVRKWIITQRSYADHDPDLLEAAEEQAKAIEAWQRDNGCKTPDL